MRSKAFISTLLVASLIFLVNCGQNSSQTTTSQQPKPPLPQSENDQKNSAESDLLGLSKFSSAKEMNDNLKLAVDFDLIPILQEKVDSHVIQLYFQFNNIKMQFGRRLVVNHKYQNEVMTSGTELFQTSITSDQVLFLKKKEFALKSVCTSDDCLNFIFSISFKNENGELISSGDGRVIHKAYKFQWVDDQLKSLKLAQPDFKQNDGLLALSQSQISATAQILQKIYQVHEFILTMPDGQSSIQYTFEAGKKGFDIEFPITGATDLQLTNLKRLFLFPQISTPWTKIEKNAEQELVLGSHANLPYDITILASDGFIYNSFLKDLKFSGLNVLVSFKTDSVDASKSISLKGVLENSQVSSEEIR